MLSIDRHYAGAEKTSYIYQTMIYLHWIQYSLYGHFKFNLLIVVEEVLLQGAGSAGLWILN